MVNENMSCFACKLGIEYKNKLLLRYIACLQFFAVFVTSSWRLTSWNRHSFMVHILNRQLIWPLLYCMGKIVSTCLVCLNQYSLVVSECFCFAMSQIWLANMWQSGQKSFPSTFFKAFPNPVFPFQSSFKYQY